MAEEAIFSFILDSLRDLVIDETKLLYGVEDQVQKLEEQLKQMHWFLRDTDSANPERVLQWVIRVRNLAYEAEYLIESYAIKVASPRQGGIRGTIKRISGCLNECYHRHNIGSDIETLMSKISDLTDSLTTYGITQIMKNTDDVASRRPVLKRTYSRFNDEDEMFVGSDNSINMLVEKLVCDKYRSITLCGMGGLGKTTLARKLYHHPVVMKHFDGFAWVCISQQWNKDDILQDIVIKLMPDQKIDDIKKWGDAKLVRELSQYLRTRKCLVVLDDIWAVDAWHSIEAAIPIKENGSTILLTTRISEVGTHVDVNGYKHEPQFLTVDDSWKLLCNKALKGQRPRYAEDAEIKVETLYQYWIAEGMVSSEDRMGHNETLMDVAEHYLNELAERCMVFVKKEEDYAFTRFKSCRLHDLMRDLCIRKAKEEKFHQSMHYGKIHDIDEGRETSTICRLSISFHRENANRFVPPTKAVRRSLRSFTLDGYKVTTSKLKLSEFVMVKVLSLDGVGEDEGVCSVIYPKMFDPLSIRKLVHLRYLMLSNIEFRIMSSTISNLKQLQTLDLRGCRNFWWNSDVWNFPRLNHLYLPYYNIQLGDPAKKLGFDAMPQLEILKGFNNTTCNAKHLSTLTNLRKLEAEVKDSPRKLEAEVKDSPLEDLEELINQVRKLTQLRDLELTVYIDDLSSEKAEAIMNDILSYSNLVTLSIEGKLSKFPEYDTGLCRNLRSLELWGCEIEEDPVRTLERLPNLRRLVLDDNSYVGKEMSCHASGFPQLRILRLVGLLNLEKWEIEEGAMPNLTELRIERCSKLSMIPAGLRSNTLLKDLTIGYMPEEFMKRIRVNEEGEEGPDFHKLRHVQTINVSRLPFF